MATRKPPEDVPVASTSAPPDPSAEELLLAGSGTGTTTATTPSSDAPTMAPPGTAAAEATAAAAGWLTNKKVLMLYQRSAPKDGWVFLDGGTGWKQLLQGDDLASRGIGELAAGGRAAGSLVHAYEGPTGTIDSFYLW